MMRHKIYHNQEKVLKLYYNGSSPTWICEEYNIPESTFFYWLSKYPNGLHKSENYKDRLRNWPKMVSHTKKLEAENAFLKRTLVKNLSRKERMTIIDAEYGKESLHVQCEALDLPRGTYLNHRDRNKNNNAWFKKREAEYLELITKIFMESGKTYGFRKITAIMHRYNKPVSARYVRKVMVEAGLYNEISARIKDRLLVARHLREAANSAQDFNVRKINQVWVSDTSAILVNNRYYFVCVYIDLFSRKVLGWNLGRNNSSQLVKRTFLQAYKRRNSPKGLIIHTDNGACYTSFSFNQTLSKLGLTHSYSRVRVPHDNAVAESFFSILKREGIYLYGYPNSFRELKTHIKMFIEKYNSTRPHQHLDYLSPNEFEKKHQ